MKNSDFKAIISNTLDIEASELIRLKEYLNYDNALLTIKLISTCKGKILVTGCGTSAQIAKKIVHSLNCINVPAFYLNPSDAVHGSLGSIDSKDIVIFISKGGNTSELTCFIENIKAKKSKIIYVGEEPTSKLGKACDIFLQVKIIKEPDQFNMLATSSSMTVLGLFDAICICIIKYNNFTMDDFEINHPNGAVGKRLKNRK